VIINTKEKYDARYRRRGDMSKRHWARSFMKATRQRAKDLLHGTAPMQIGHGSKPNHKERAVDITTCYPLIGR
jgi:hypothetical protein